MGRKHILEIHRRRKGRAKIGRIFLLDIKVGGGGGEEYRKEKNAVYHRRRRGRGKIGRKHLIDIIGGGGGHQTF